VHLHKSCFLNAGVTTSLYINGASVVLLIPCELGIGVMVQEDRSNEFVGECRVFSLKSLLRRAAGKGLCFHYFHHILSLVHTERML
jgi:hypothetical protein